MENKFAYESPKLEVIVFSASDVLTTSVPFDTEEDNF